MNQNQPLNFNQILIEPLNTTHLTKYFDCYTGYKEDLDMNDFLRNDALNEKYEGWNQTYVATIKGNNQVVGFFSIATDSFKVKPTIKNEQGKPYYQVPATKIARIAVDKNYQNKGLGSFMIRYAIGFIIEQIAKNAGCRYITLDSYPQRVEWYKKNFFFKENTMIKENKNNFVNLILDLKTFP